MKKIKNRIFLDFEKEEKWINEMSKQGWHLEKFFLYHYTFRKGEPEKYIYRNEFLSGLKENEKNEYFDFLRESGIEVVHTFGFWSYFRKATVEGPFELYTDAKSKISYYNRIFNIFLLLFITNLVMAIENITISKNGYSISAANSSAGLLSFAVAILLFIPTLKIYQRKKELMRQQQFFE